MGDSSPAATLERTHAAPRALRATAIDRWLVRCLFASMGDPPFRVVLASGEEVGAAGAPLARVVFRDRGALYRLAVDPDIQFGDLYSGGRIEVEGDLVAFLETVYRAQAENPGWRARLGAWIRAPRNTIARARANVHHHYDLGNEFFRLWLDERMVYTCAYFPTAPASLEEAQVAKMDHVCRKLRLREGERVVEAGCGWGSLALHMARRYGVRVKAFNVSREQIAYARVRASAEGLGDRVEFIEDDYRNVSGRFDAFVSVGMLEHVGTRHYRALGAVIDRVLSAGGRGLIHTIGRNRPAPSNPWITARIFPGGYTPSLGEMAGVFEPFSFSILDVENLRLHYALTLRHWLERFEAQREQIRRMFDERFVRMWRLYLAGSQAAFTTGAMQLFQVVFARPGNNDLPLTRAHLYPLGAGP